MRYRVLRNKSYFFYIIAQALSKVGDGLYTIAIMWLLIKISGGSGLAVGGAFGIFTIGDIISGFLSGPIVDHFNKKKILVLTDFLRFLIILLLYYLSLKGLLNVFRVTVILFILSLLSPLFSAGEFTLIPHIVSHDELLEANGIISGMRGLVSILVPALGGIIVARFGYNICFLTDAISFLVSCAGVAFVKYSYTSEPHQGKSKLTNIFKSIPDGFKFIRASQFLFTLSIFVIFINFIQGPVEPLIPVLSDRYGLGSSGFGIIASSFSFGALLFSFLSGLVPKKITTGRLIVYGLLIMGVSSMFFGAFRNLIIIAILSFLMGFGNALTNIPLSALLQRTIPSDKLGVVSSFIYTFSGIAQPISMSLAGFVSDRVPLSIIFPVIGFLTLISAFVGFNLKGLKKF
jgi:MFS family permease